MKIVQINATCGQGSTGKICVAVSRRLTQKGVENAIYYTLSRSQYTEGEKYAYLPYTKFQALKSRVYGNYGFNSRFITKKLIKSLDAVCPDIVHLHNLHAHNVHLGMLFRYFKDKRIKVYWTFHDCWAFTAYCPYFDSVGCDRWQSECHDCPQRKRYSWFLDRSRTIFLRKKEMVQGVNLTIVTPSKWLAELVKKSFLKDFSVRVIHNGIDLSVFKPTESDFRKQHGLEGKVVLLGVTYGWEKRKGLDVFCELARRLDDRYRIVLVGTDKKVDKLLPESILSIHRTENQTELAKIYSAADLFVNPTREENYPTVNMEAIACGTPVVTFDTGGSGEIPDATCGITVKMNDMDALEKAIIEACQNKPFTKEACLARAASFDQNERFAQIIAMYEKTESFSVTR